MCMSGIYVSIWATAHLPLPLPNNKLGLTLSQVRDKCTIAQVPTLIKYFYLFIYIFYCLCRGLYDSNSTHDGSLNSESSNNFAKRKPFHYNTLRNPVVTPHDMDIAAKFNRYRYISRLSKHNVVRTIRC